MWHFRSGYKVLIGKQPKPHFPSGMICDEDFSLHVSMFRILYVSKTLLSS